MRGLALWVWHRIVGEPCCGNAVKSMQKSLRKLEKANEFQATKAANMRRVAEAAAKAEATAMVEARKAEQVRKNLASLLQA